jgi:hypothetical protein
MNATAIAGILSFLIPKLLTAVETVAVDNGKSWEQVLADVAAAEFPEQVPVVAAVANHLTPGAPAAPALS